MLRAVIQLSRSDERNYCSKFLFIMSYFYKVIMLYDFVQLFSLNTQDHKAKSEYRLVISKNLLFNRKCILISESNIFSQRFFSNLLFDQRRAVNKSKLQWIRFNLLQKSYLHFSNLLNAFLAFSDIFSKKYQNKIFKLEYINKKIWMFPKNSSFILNTESIHNKFLFSTVHKKF